MKHLKHVYITILTFLFIHISAAEIVDLNNDKFNNKHAGFSFYNYDTLSDISQEVLLQLSAKNEISQINLPLTNYDLSEKRRIYVSYKNGKVMQNSNCKLICVSETGIYTYSKKSLMYIPYKYIKYIQRGISFGKQLNIAVIAGGAIGVLVGITDSYSPVGYAILYGILGVASSGLYYITIGGPIYLVSTLSNNYRFKIKFNEINGASFRKKVLEKEYYYGSRMQIKDYPGNALKNQSDTSVPQIENDTTILADQKLENWESKKFIDTVNKEILKIDTTQKAIQIPEIAKNTKDSIIAGPVQSKPSQLKDEFPKLNTRSGKINPTWMYFGYNKLDVNEKKLMAKFKNIQGTKIITENLQNLNPSELQFLAITIATLNGFDFKNVASFTESQSQYLKNYISYISTDVHAESEINQTNIQELDIDNITLIYSVLKEKKN